MSSEVGADSVTFPEPLDSVPRRGTTCDEALASDFGLRPPRRPLRGARHKNRLRHLRRAEEPQGRFWHATRDPLEPGPLASAVVFPKGRLPRKARRAGQLLRRLESDLVSSSRSGRLTTWNNFPGHSSPRCPKSHPESGPQGGKLWERPPKTREIAPASTVRRSATGELSLLAKKGRILGRIGPLEGANWR